MQSVDEFGEELVHRPCCFSGVRFFWQRLGIGGFGAQLEEEEDLPTQEVLHLFYEDKHEAMCEIALEGGDGDAVFFAKVGNNTKAQKAGVRLGDELVQVNLIDPATMFWKRAEEILPVIVGPIVLWWKKTPPRPASERTRIHRKKRRTPEDEDTDVDEEEALYANDDWKGPVSRAIPLERGEWQCGSCGGFNFDIQEFCRRCGLRDSRLPVRPGRMPRLAPFRLEHPPIMFPADGLTKEDLKTAAHEGMKMSDPTGLPDDFSRSRPRKLR
mmetsp:Transcript_124409/g.194913  ORF Transcript_124409/g.194913 Transcript_124409/m.194913 type:complete len:270 (+) Transcript_124409:55-864(+)|eukprot:CAMPEP_0169127736 /NCGR_PEP_ID=MMETSP1015-20121227/36180_1 /TAXON_ID=342587 /ORGANISM="Karlodinium micrum, Strain CCMP2283" /LENGTH=269 /DNA_ID=CAMNT_0009191565 /DNA_START=50 /DNA_END=859 /DNA_ORIENTATION=+